MKKLRITDNDMPRMMLLKRVQAAIGQQVELFGYVHTAFLGQQVELFGYIHSAFLGQHVELFG